MNLSYRSGDIPASSKFEEFVVDHGAAVDRQAPKRVIPYDLTVDKGAIKVE
jgi:hypothetical protein